MTLRQRIRYLTDGLDKGAPGLTLDEIALRLPDVPQHTLQRAVREMWNADQLVRRRLRYSSGPATPRAIVDEADREARLFAWNGNQQRVLEAIERGHALIGEIMEATGLEEQTVRNHVRRLCQGYKVHREHTPDGRHLARYVPTRRRCLLAESWTGLRPIERATERLAA